MVFELTNVDKGPPDGAKSLTEQIYKNIVIHLYAINLKYFPDICILFFHMHANVQNITDYLFDV